MVVDVLRAARVQSSHMQAASMGSIALCLSLWIRAKTVDQDVRGNAERRAIFVGLWPPMFWLVGEEIERRDARPGTRIRAVVPGRRRWGRRR